MEAPEYLDEIATREWDRVVEALKKKKLFTDLDMSALAAYCSAYSTFVAANKLIAEEGLTFWTNQGGMAASPAVGIKERASKIIKEFCSEFGLTPSARGKMELEDAPLEGSTLDSYVDTMKKPTPKKPAKKPTVRKQNVKKDK